MNIEDIKEGDWLINKCGVITQNTKQTTTYSPKRGSVKRNKPLTQNVVDIFNLKHLTIKPEYLDNHDITIKVTEPWMIEALNYVAKRIRREVCYCQTTRIGNQHSVISGEVGVTVSMYLQDSDYTEVPFWDVVYGEEQINNKENDMCEDKKKYEWTIKK